MKKPSSWFDFGMTWDAFPVLAVPGQHGWALYEAIRERIDYALGADWQKWPDLPEVLTPFIQDFNPNQDYKIMENNMHNAISELINYFRNWTDPAKPLWRENTILTALEEEERREPNPYFLCAKWLYQMFRIVNYLRPGEDIISLSWIDEAEPGYTTGNLYDEDKALFEESIEFQTAVIQPGGSKSGSVVGGAGMPSNVKYFSCDRDPCNSYAPFVQAVDVLKAQYRTDRLTFGLFVDSSGSMSLNTIQPAYNQFKEYLRKTYPKCRIIERTAGDERWLVWTKEYIDNLKFNFEYFEEEAEPSE